MTVAQYRRRAQRALAKAEAAAARAAQMERSIKLALLAGATVEPGHFSCWLRLLPGRSPSEDPDDFELVIAGCTEGIQ